MEFQAENFQRFSFYSVKFEKEEEYQITNLHGSINGRNITEVQETLSEFVKNIRSKKLAETFLD